MNVKAKILFSERFNFNGGNYVKIPGFINELGIFQISVKEELVPDICEGKEVSLDYGIGIDGKHKPFLKLNGISLV